MNVRVGTSGYNFPEWKGTFYPAKTPESKMLEYYAQRLGTVEINYTFYRMPNAKAVAGWDAATPPGFTFVLKAPQRITHIARLRDVDDPLRYFLETGRKLGPKLGPILFQLPPNFKKDVARLNDLLTQFPADLRCAWEFRRRGLREEGSRAVGRDREGFGEGVGGRVHLFQARGVGDRAEAGAGVRQTGLLTTHHLSRLGDGRGQEMLSGESPAGEIDLPSSHGVALPITVSRSRGARLRHSFFKSSMSAARNFPRMESVVISNAGSSFLAEVLEYKAMTARRSNL